MSIGKTLIGRRHVQPSVVSTLEEIMVEGTFPSGTYLVTVHHPVSTDDGDLEKALYSSFLPVPTNEMFPLPDAGVYDAEKQPGAIIAVKGNDGVITLNKDRKRIKLKVKSTGDRPIQVGHASIIMRISLNSLADRLTLSLHRDQSATPIRPHTGAWVSPRHSRRNLSSIRARGHKDGHIGTDWWKQDHQGW